MPCCTRSARPPTAPSTASVDGGISTLVGVDSCTLLMLPGRPNANQPSVALPDAASGQALAPPMARPFGTYPVGANRSPLMATSTVLQPVVPRLQSAKSLTVWPRSALSVDDRWTSCEVMSAAT